MEPREIQIQGAREHNLKGVDVSIPRERFVVITGPSGSGKSSLAKDTLYAEGHRRYETSRNYRNIMIEIRLSILFSRSLEAGFERKPGFLLHKILFYLGLAFILLSFSSSQL